MSEPVSLGSRALALCFEGKNPPEIALILTAESSRRKPFTPIEARELYQTEFRRQRSDWR